MEIQVIQLPVFEFCCLRVTAHVKAFACGAVVACDRVAGRQNSPWVIRPNLPGFEFYPGNIADNKVLLEFVSDNFVLLPPLRYLP